LYSPVEPSVNYLQNLTNVAEEIGIQLTVGNISVRDDATPSNKAAELDALEAFTSWGAENGHYFDPDVILELFILPCSQPCRDKSCKKCHGLGAAMAAFLQPPAYWSKSGK
jgi:hypothetical protein